VSWASYFPNSVSLLVKSLEVLSPSDIYCLVVISVLLSIVIFMSSSHQSQRIEDNNTEVRREEPKLPCRHPIVERDQLHGNANYEYYKNAKCVFGFKVMENVKHKGSRCNSCGIVFCVNPGCGCKRL
jgi:hypothetical protein